MFSNGYSFWANCVCSKANRIYSGASSEAQGLHMTELFSFSRSPQPFSLPPAPFITHQTCFWSALHQYLFRMGFLKRNMHTKQIKIKTKTKTTKQNKNKRKKNPTGSGREEEMKPYWAEVSRWQSREGNCLTQSMKAAQKDKMHRGRRKKKSIWASCTGMKWLLSFLLPAPMLHVDITHPVL